MSTLTQASGEELGASSTCSACPRTQLAMLGPSCSRG